MLPFTCWYGSVGSALLTVLVISLRLTPALGGDLEEGCHYTNTWTVEFHSDLSEDDVTAIAHSHGFITYGKVLKDSHIYEFHHPRVSKRSADHADEYTQLLADHMHVRSIEQQIGKTRVKRGHIPEADVSLKDPLWHQTWYLIRGMDSRTKYDMNVIPAWKKGFTGKNIVVTILDDGIERNHPDLEANYDAEASTDINGKDEDPMPRYDPSNENRHGTRCAGEVAAVANNSHCSVGVAYHAKIGGIRMLDGSVTDVVESKSLSHNPQKIDIYSSSWGPDDNGRTVDGPGKLAKQAFIDGVEKGRGGKGNIFMWASGNGGSHSDSCACDGYTNSIYTLSVSSASQTNKPPWYLEQCASTIAATYSSGASSTEKQIVTTDLRKLCTTTHTGTSASAPLAAGLVAVMLEANPKLTWRDVQYVTLSSANPEPLISGQFKTNGVGRKYSHKFGYGLMDCAKMADMALDWVTVPPQLIKRLPRMNPEASLKTKYTRTVEVPSCSDNDNGCIKYLEHVQLALTMTSSRRGRLSVKVTSPMGTESIVLPSRSSDSASAGFNDWPFMSVHFWGEDPKGTWQFEINNAGQPGKVSFYQLILFGVAVNPFDKKRRAPEQIHCHDTCASSNSTYLACSGSGADQCKQCQPDLYRQEDTNLCVQSCDDGYYTDEEQHTCKQCNRLCKTCTGDKIDMCTSCNSGLLLDNNGHCVEECPVSYFPDLENQLCQACKGNCTNCVSLDECIVCGDGFDVVSGKCKLKCVSREYRNQAGVCTPCNDKNCELCSKADQCDACDSDYKLYHDECLKECPASTYVAMAGRDSGRLECLDCHKDCATCNEGQDNNCLSCHNLYQMTSSHTCVVNTTCQLGQFRELDVGDCEDCHPSCKTCHGGTEMGCTSCKGEMYLKDGACVKDCGPGLYRYIDPEDQHASCQRCHPSCANCSASTNTSCTSCSDTAVLGADGVCQPVCPPNSYLKRDDTAVIASTNGTPCSNCSSPCLTCTGPRTADCTSCSEDKALNHAGECVTDCDDGYFRKNTAMEGIGNQFVCHICNPNCVTCNGSTSSHCLSCQTGLILFHNQCVKKPQCYPNQYYNSTANECLRCHRSCSGCIGPTELECTSCEDKKDLYVPPEKKKPADSGKSGQCVLCCGNEKIDPGICCDCSNPGSPRCDASDAIAPDMAPAKKDQGKSSKKLVVIAVIGIISCIIVYGVVFMVLQYRSHGRCTWQTSSSTLLIDGGGIIEYSSLTDKDVDIHYAAEDEINSEQYGSKAVLNYDSD